MKKILISWIILVSIFCSLTLNANTLNIDELKKQAEQGDPLVQFNLAEKYRTGEGVLQDYILAHMWYNIASANGVNSARVSRNSLAKIMSSTQVSEAQSKAKLWIDLLQSSTIIGTSPSKLKSNLGNLAIKNQGSSLAATPALSDRLVKTTPIVVTRTMNTKITPNAGDNRGFADCDGCPQMIKVPAGKYSRGTKYGPNDQRPKHTVTIPYSFSVGAYEVTIANWESCLAEGGCEGYRPYETGADINLPVGNVNWKDAQNYTRWLSQKTGQVYRLLSEGEWEYVARGGMETRFSWGDSLKEGNNTLNSSDNVGGRISSMSQSMAQGFLSAAIGSMNASKSGVTPVGSYVANPWGLYDVHGNNWEWVEDCYNEDYYGAPNKGSARTKNCSKRGKRVLRGGLVMINMNLHLTDSRHRSSRGTNSREFNIGFRVARDN